MPEMTHYQGQLMDGAAHLDEAFSTLSSVVRHMGHANV